MNAGMRIKKIRDEKGLSTTELGKMTGISQSTISKLENGKRKADIDLIEKIAEALNISTDRLTGESASSIIEDRLEELEMSLSELAEKTKVSLKFLTNLDDIDPIDPDYAAITRVAKSLGLPPSKLRAALARQEPPVYEGEVPRISAYEDFADIDFEKEPAKIVNPDIRAVARAGKKLTAEQAEVIRKYAEFMFPEAFNED